MNKYIIKIEGMMCGMCETHVNDVFRRNFKIKKVSSSHFKNEAIVITPEELTEEVIKTAFKPTGYKVLSIKKEAAIKKGLFWK